MQQPPANPVAAFFRTTNLVFAVYDVRRGQCEGEEAEKLLSFFPTIAPIHVRTSIVGLAQAVTSFAATLTQDGGRFQSMVAENNKWVMCEVEPYIWMLAVVRKAWAGATCTNAAFKNLLTSMYDVFVLLHGKMGTRLEQDPTGFALRRVLQPLLDEVGSRLLRPEAAASREAGGHGALLANPLAPHCPGAVPLMPTSHHTFLAIQSLVNQLLVASFYGARLVGGVVVLWGGLPLWSTLGPRDTEALVTLAVRALVPAAKAAQKSRPAGAGTSMAVAAGNGGAAAAAAPGETAHETLLSPLQWRAGGGIQPASLSPATSSLATVAAGLGLSFAAAGGGGGGGSGGSAAAAASGVGSAAPAPAAAAASGGGGGVMFGPSTPGGGISLASILGFGVGSGVVPASASASGSTPPLPVSSSAAAGPSSFSSTSAAAAGGGGGGGVGSALPPFLSSFLRPRLRPSLYSAPGGALPLDAVLPMTHVWLRGSNEWAQLLPYHRGQLLVLALLHDGPPPATEVLAALAAVLGRGSGPAAAALAAEMPARSVMCHEKGHRYCYTDDLCHATRCSPLKKVLTLSSSALRHLAHLRSKMDDWDASSGEGGGEGGGGGQQSPNQQLQGGGGGLGTDEGHAAGQAPVAASRATAAADAASAPAPGAGSCRADGGDRELVVRTSHDAWLVLRAAAGGRRLYTVSEQGALAELAMGAQGLEPTLAAAVAPTDALCDRLFPGVFLQP
ncbi:hypothetical protein PLESTF_001250000 [Pleodorina starrii]|nr:hypothetical protein PLESTF_001250000 [Pleodorina starrii]